MKKSIKLCPYCKEPLIWTFINLGTEWYCINCKNEYPMFCDSISIEYYDEKYKYYKIKQKIYKKIFDSITKDLIPYRSYRKNCDKCKNEYHRQHLSENEKEKDKISREVLKKIRFNKK